MLCIVARATRFWCRKSPDGCDFEPGLYGHLTTGKNNPAVNGTVSNQGKTRQPWERDGFNLLSAVPKIQWASNCHCPNGY